MYIYSTSVICAKKAAHPWAILWGSLGMIWVRLACVLYPCNDLVRGRLEEAAARVLAVRARSGRKGIREFDADIKEVITGY